MRAVMAAGGELVLVLVLVLGLLVSAHCDVRARDPEVEEEEEEEEGGRAGGGGGGGGGAEFPYLVGTEMPLLDGEGNHPTRTGNWCAFVQKRAVTMAMECGTEKYTIKSQSPCPSRTPDCQLVMYKLSTRPIYRQKQKIVTALLWRCCPGYGGKSCEDAVPDAQLDSGSSALTGGSEAASPESQGPEDQQHVDPNLEQNDHQVPVAGLHYSGFTHDNATNHAHKPHHSSHHDHDHDHDRDQDPPHHHPHQRELPEPPGGNIPPGAALLPFPDAAAPLPAPHMMMLVMAQLRPLLEGFNRSLEHLSRQVSDLTHEVAQLRERQLEAGPLDGSELDEAAAAEEERLDAKLDKVFKQVGEVRRQVESQQADVEHKLHYHQVMLQYNLTSLKADVDMKLKRQQKMLQVSLQSINSTLTELRPDHPDHPDQPDQDLPSQPFDSSVFWEAIERLDNMVVNNTVKVGGLMEDVEVSSGKIQLLRRDVKELEKQINRTARTSQIQFMETGLEVEAAKVVVLQRVNELAANLSQQGELLRENSADVDYLYKALYRTNLSADCDCKGLTAAVARLERGVANVSELANENRLTLEEGGGGGQWGGDRDWEPALGALQLDLQQVKESFSWSLNRIKNTEQSVAQLNQALNDGLVDVAGLKEADKKMTEHMRHLGSTFNSLLKDAVRHSDVLELLLGEEVLEFLQWAVSEQEGYSIPALKEQLRVLQERVEENSLLGDSLGDGEEVPSADQPSSSSPQLPPDDWLPSDMRRSSGGGPSRERQLLLHQHRGDGSDLWNLEKRVEELGLKVLRLEEKRANVSAEGAAARLQAEVLGLRRGLEEHLWLFNNVFSNTDTLARTDATLELDKLWQLTKSKDGREKKKRRVGGGGNRQSRRESGVRPVPFGQSEDALLLLATSRLTVSSGVLTSPSRGRFYSHSGSFTAPVDGIYLFVLTLDLRPGPAHVVLTRGHGAAPVSLHRREVTEAGPLTATGLLPLSRGEEARLELKRGVWAESEDNVLAVMLLHRNT